MENGEEKRFTSFYSYDRAGNITKSIGKAGERLVAEETDASGTITTIQYEYDKLQRLTDETITKGNDSLTNTYSYDSVSNRTKKNTVVDGAVENLIDTADEKSDFHTGITTYTYNNLNQLVEEKREEGSIYYTYDKNGNLVGKEGKEKYTYSYDGENRLLRATVQSGNSVTIESYTYDYEVSFLVSCFCAAYEQCYGTNTKFTSLICQSEGGKGVNSKDGTVYVKQ